MYVLNCWDVRTELLRCTYWIAEMYVLVIDYRFEWAKLYGIVTYYTVLYGIVTYCTILYFTVLWRIILYCNVLYRTVLYCNVLYRNIQITYSQEPSKTYFPIRLFLSDNLYTILFTILFTKIQSLRINKRIILCSEVNLRDPN